jgi:Yip1 domain
MSEEYSSETQSQEKLHDDGKSWLAGFVDVLTAPETLALRRVTNPGRVIALAALLITFASVGVQYLYSVNDGIRGQMYTMQAKSVEKIARKQGVSDAQIEQQLDAIRERQTFSFVQTLGVSLIFAMLGVFLFGLLFWIMQRLFNSEPPPVAVIIGLVNYTASIAVLGAVLMAFMQFAANSITASPSPAFFVNAVENPYLMQFLSRINPFSIWEYVVAGILTARHVGMSRTHGIAIGATAFAIVLIITGGFGLFMANMFGA